MAKLMTGEELAGYLRVDKKTIYRLLKKGKIPATRVGQQWRFDKASIDEWLHQKPTEIGANILVVDDDETIRSLFKKTLKELGHKVITAETGLKGLELVKQQDFAMVFLDLKMPGIDGVEFFRQVKTIKPRLPIILITSYPDSDIMARALAQAPFGLMNKPFNESDIITAVKTFMPVSTANSTH
jgi:excisionase family DNA binding protein